MISAFVAPFLYTGVKGMNISKNLFDAIMYHESLSELIKNSGVMKCSEYGPNHYLICQ